MDPPTWSPGIKTALFTNGSTHGYPVLKQLISEARIPRNNLPYKEMDPPTWSSGIFRGTKYHVVSTLKSLMYPLKKKWIHPPGHTVSKPLSSEAPNIA